MLIKTLNSCFKSLLSKNSPPKARIILPTKRNFLVSFLATKVTGLLLKAMKSNGSQSEI